VRAIATIGEQHHITDKGTFPKKRRTHQSKPRLKLTLISSSCHLKLEIDMPTGIYWQFWRKDCSLKVGFEPARRLKRYINVVPASYCASRKSTRLAKRCARKSTINDLPKHLFTGSRVCLESMRSPIHRQQSEPEPSPAKMP
jgi:hypothetical protein